MFYGNLGFNSNTNFCHNSGSNISVISMQWHILAIRIWVISFIGVLVQVNTSFLWI